MVCSLWLLMVANSFGEEDPVLIFPQIADGGGIQSEIFLTNPSSTDDSGRLVFKDGSGQPLTLSVAGSEGSELGYTVPSGGALRIQTDGKGALKTGYVLVIPDRAGPGVVGSIVYNYLGFEVSIPGAPLSRQFHMYAEMNSQGKSGFAFANPSENDLDISAVLLSENQIRDRHELDLKTTLNKGNEGWSGTNFQGQAC
jgi:hypothetical protein